MINKSKKTISGLALSALCMLLLSTVTKAATVSVNGDKDTAAVGDTYTVSVNIDGAEGAAVAPDVSVNYDVNRLEFVSCSGEYGGGGGGFITLSGNSADITFNILSGGQADVDVSAIFDGEPEAQIVTATIIVEGEDTAAVDDRAREDMGTGVEPGTIASSDGRLVSAVFADEFMPVGFYKTTVTYEEQMVEAAQFDMGGIVLLYVTDADGNNGNFVVYDQGTGELNDFLQITGIENRFIIALKAGEEVQVPENFTKAVLQWNAQTLEAYAYTGQQIGDGTVSVSDFFLLYAISSEGNKGWYMYDQNEGTYQRYVEGLHGSSNGGSSDSIISQIASPTNEKDGGVNVVFIIAIVLAVLLLALIITVIVMAVKLHEFNSYDYIDEDEEYEEDVHASENVGNRRSPAESDNYLERLAANSQNVDPRDAGHEEQGGDAKPEQKPVEQKITKTEENDEAVETNMSDEMPKSENIYEKYRKEDEAREVAAGSGSQNVADDLEQAAIPEGFVVRNKNARVSKEEIEEQEMYERDVDDLEEEDLFSPRDRSNLEDDYDDEYGRGRKLTRAEKKELKAREKARKKEEKRLKKEYGEYGPVDWDSWQEGKESGARTAAAHMSGQDEGDRPARRETVVDERAARRPAPQMDEESRRRTPQQMEEQPRRRPVQNTPEDEYEEGGERPLPRDMMRGIPANDNRAPVQAKPVQQFDFDDDFEFEFLDLDDDDE